MGRCGGSGAAGNERERNFFFFCTFVRRRVAVKLLPLLASGKGERALLAVIGCASFCSCRFFFAFYGTAAEMEIIFLLVGRLLDGGVGWVKWSDWNRDFFSEG